MIDARSQSWIELAQRIVGQAGKVHDGINAVQMAIIKVTDIGAEFAVRGDCPLHGIDAFAKIANIDAGHAVARRFQSCDDSRTDIAKMTGDENMHDLD